MAPADDHGLPDDLRTEMRQGFRRFYISYVESVKPENVRVLRKDGYTLNVKYEVRRPMIYNLDFVASFDKSVDLTRQGAID